MTCATCDKQIEECAACDEEACAHPCCYRCLVKAVGQSVLEPHAHGG